MGSPREWFALSVRQPWAELLISGRKSIEVRSWGPEYRGGLWLHAGSKSDPLLDRHFGLDKLHRGGFIGSIQLVAVVPFTRDRWNQWRPNHLDPGEYRHGLFAWLMEFPHRFQEFIAAKGQLSLFRPSRENLDRLVYAEDTSGPQNS